MSTCIISGGSRGLGLALVSRFLDEGWRVGSFARSRTTAIADLEASRDLYFEEIDATSDSAVRDFVAKFVRRFGRIDVVVNNAAVGQDSLLAHTSDDQIARIVEVNLTAPLRLTRLAIRQMLRQASGGHIINVGSICASRGYAGLSVYAATKGGLESANLALAREYAGRIRFNTVAPGFFASEMSSVLQSGQIEAITRRTPTGRLADPADVVDAVWFLLGGSNLDACVVRVDGGASS